MTDNPTPKPLSLSEIYGLEAAVDLREKGLSTETKFRDHLSLFVIKKLIYMAKEQAIREGGDAIRGPTAQHKDG